MQTKSNFRWKTPSRLQIKTPTQQQIVALSQMMIRAESTKRRPVKVKHFEKEQIINNVESQQYLHSIPIIQENLNKEMLVLKNNQITSMKGLQEYKNLNYIDLSANQIKEITEINQLNIQVLMISYNKLKEVKNLPQCLKILDAKINMIERVDLSNLNNLKVLNLQKNNISSINLYGLYNLKKVYLDENKITYFTEIPYLEQLQLLSLQNNQIIKAFEQSQLAKIPKIKQIYVQGNPFSRFVQYENYLDYLCDLNGQIKPNKLRCKSVETQKSLKLDTSDALISKEQKLNIIDFNEQTTPFLQTSQNKQGYTFNQQLIQKIIKKNSGEYSNNYRAEISQQGKRDKYINQFSVKQAQINFVPDFSFIKKINKKTKSDLFTQNEIEKINQIKQQFNHKESIEKCVSKYFILSKCLIVYGNPKNIDQIEVDSLILKYYELNSLENCNLFTFNKITKLTLQHNRICHLHEINLLQNIFQKIEILQIEKNEINTSTILKPYINYLFSLDERDKRNFQKFSEIRSNIQENIEIDETFLIISLTHIFYQLLIKQMRNDHKFKLLLYIIMVKYECPRCKHIQNYDGQCSNCLAWDAQMKQIEDLKKFNRDLNVAFYADGGCCGCTEKKRRNFFYILGILMLIIGLVFLIGQFGENSTETAMGLIGLGVIWLIAGFCCPNGCSGEYKRTNQGLIE
ncbi:unnamed protein product [Paramecium sonneborni]|uniref:Leucine-rich repeat protein n=1 Tax=Paramecium sonneborni TaxID=65129 RepID=A0A8S1KIC3_9CILI|nr:unnamed protein product [Paramecium sonneborni]